jgi:hypothetical protein
MPRTNTSLVEILREFLEAQLLLHELAERFRRDELTFSELQRFVGDNEGSVLFRLKEKCHVLFRSEAPGRRKTRLREALFDLAVGSLFHEAMKFREDFYQREVYGPRVRKLRADAGDDAAQLFLRFERILSSVSDRLDVGFAETESLMEQSWEQLRVLLADQSEPGLVTRFLIERGSSIDALVSPGLDDLLAEIHGSTALGYESAARSYLLSGHYTAAVAAFEEASARGPISDSVRHLPFFARGMAAYLEGDYAACVARLKEWVASGSATVSELSRIAHAALSSLDQLIEGPDRDEVLVETSSLLEKIPVAT